MDFILSYSGKVKSSKDRNITNAIRKSISDQLERLCKDERLMSTFEWLSNPNNKITGSTTIAGTNFIPVFGVATSTRVELELTFLNGSDSQSPIRNGDLDNRLKRVIDGLRCPITNDEFAGGVLFNHSRCFLLDK